MKEVDRSYLPRMAGGMPSKEGHSGGERNEKEGRNFEKAAGRSHIAYKSLSNRLLHDDKLVETIYVRAERWSNPSRE
ncbi:unnamed protein product [Dovyalis caffra]|uniref:Uncharacterized protein n=1 Tax=Dovyalis caffra TaxID=77055 RepID=A0AAV1S0I1_9ROSI|nr:unnamed protein product [Dovyalis caffra]